jgi:RNA polymerase sigma factor (sigma-70 family)
MDFEWFSIKGDARENREVSDAELVRRICSGDRKAEEHLFCDRLSSTVAFLSRQYRYEDLPNDLYVHLREDAWRRLRTWNGGSSLVTWVRQVGAHLCITRARNAKGREVPSGAHDAQLDVATPTTPYDDLIAAYDRAALLSGIESLREPRDRLVLRWLCLEERSVAEVAEELDVPKEHAYVLRNRAVGRLREVVKDAIAK